mgnify:CR=1 FL=1
MKGKGSYALFFLVTVMVQVFLLNNLTVSVLFAPMAYVACLIMMPLDSSPIKMLLTALAIGLLMDFTMGTEGLNVIATLPVAFFRRPILSFVAGFSDFDKEEGAPSEKRLGVYRYHRYIVTMVVFHSLLLFSVEHLSFDNFGLFLARFVCSTLASLVAVYFLLLLFTPKFSAK